MPYGVEVFAVRYPGREDRLLEPLMETMEELVDGISPGISRFSDAPVAFFGHSMGASVAYEVALRLQAESGVQPVALFLSGRSGPGQNKTRGLSEASDAELIEDVIGMGGTDAQAFEDPDLRELILPAVRADYRLIDRYECRSPSRVLDLPVVAYYGAEDGELDGDSVGAWSTITRGPFDVRCFEGGHFYLADRPQELIGDLFSRLDSLPKAYSPRTA